MYTKKDLINMYYTLYENLPLSIYNKENIANSIRIYKSTELRYDALLKLNVK